MDDSLGLRRLLDDVVALRSAVLAEADTWAEDVAGVNEDHLASARNLAHYISLRRHDIRELQHALARLGVSSLGRSEGHVLASLNAVISALAAMADVPVPSLPEAPIEVGAGQMLLEANAQRLLGPLPPRRGTRIMVTLPSEAATDDTMVKRLVAAGMDLARVNCAHDDAAAWATMIERVHEAAPPGRTCRVAMDLGGPKMRTGPLEPGPQVVRISPDRDAFGRVHAPALVHLVSSAADLGRVSPLDDGDASDGGAAPIAVGASWLTRRAIGDGVRLTDTRGARRQMTVTALTSWGALAEVSETTYVATGTALDSGGDTTVVGSIPGHEQAHLVRVGDLVVLTRDLAPAPVVEGGSVHRIGCTLEAAFGQVEPGEVVWFDDGKLGGIVESVSAEELVVRITSARPRGTRLKAAKGINFPNSDLRVDALTAKDLEDLAFIAGHADMVQVSFVRSSADVAAVQARLLALGDHSTGIVLKIENRMAFEHLPELLFAALRFHDVGVMIARGDLAVEIGFERLAEVQEEILWLCEAAHMPVIWATQVLDTMARTGRPSRAEVTDAAMGQRAECVMLNKGPHIEEAIRVLADILERMDDHQRKGQHLLRRLRSWGAAVVE